MIKNKLKILSLAALISTSIGCKNDGGPFPQLSDVRYQLIEDSVKTTDPDFLAMTPPKYLKGLDRMEHYGGIWKHTLRFGFRNSEDSEDTAIALALNDLTYVDERVFPNDWFDGTQIYTEGVKGGSVSRCYHEYVYNLKLSTIPEGTCLAELYS